MASKSAKEKVNVTPKWSSPRFRSTRLANGDSPVGGSPATPSSTASPASTPTQQRELKKLEDYWTRHDPIQDDSPRLRSNRKSKFDVKECLNTHKKLAKNSPSAPQKEKVADLSESPIPCFSGGDHDLKNIAVSASPDPPKWKIHDEHVSKDASPNIFSKFASAKYFNKYKVAEEPKDDTASDCQKTEELHTNPSHGVVKSPAMSPDIRSFPASQSSEFSDGYPIRNLVIDESCDSDNEGYVMPRPRRKLRSEVSKEELWDGFPLKVSFKRLAPLSKRSDTMHFLSGDESSQDSLVCLETEKEINLPSIEQSDESKIPGNLDVHDEASLESTIIYEECDHEETITSDTGSVVPESVGNNTPLHTTIYPDKCTDLDKQNTPKRNKKRKLELPDTPRKRSARLLEKSLVLTPEKGSGVSMLNDSPKSSSSTCSFSSFNRLDLKSTDVCAIRNADAIPDNKALTKVHVFSQVSHVNDNVPTNLNVNHGSTTGTVPFEEQTIKEESSSTLSQPNNLETSYESLAATSFKSETDLLNKSISQILNVDCKKDNQSSTIQNNIDDKKLSDKLYAKNVSGSSEIIESVSEILDHLLDVVECHGHGPEKQIKCPSSKGQSAIKLTTESHSGEQNTDSAKLSDKAFMAKQRRSSRLADLEKRFEYLKEIAAKNDEETPTDTWHDVAENEKIISEKTFEQEGESGNTFSMHPKHFPTLANKTKTTPKEGNRSVPPLRIKLKLPFTPKSHKKKTTVKSTHSSNKILEGGEVIANDNISKAAADESKSSDKPKKKKPKHDKRKSVPEQSPNDTKSDSKPKPNKTGIGQKKGFPQVKAKKSKRYKKEAKRWSPTANVNLRLNTERRVAALGKLLGNPKLDKHACVLWSSENRRHVQLSNAGATSDELDEILRRKWEGLSEREKTRYFQRARDATRDENRHSTKRHFEVGDEEQPSSSGAAGRQQSAHPDMAQFLALDAEGQRTKLTRALHFYREVSPEEYNNLVKAYQVSVQEEQKQRASELKKPKQKSSKSKRSSASRGGRGSSKPPVLDTQAMCRKLLYEKVADNWSKIVGIFEEKKRLQRQILSDNLARLAWRLVAGEGEQVQFSEHTTSARLSQTLCDLGDLERGRKLDVEGKELAARRGQLERFESWFGDTDVNSDRLDRMVSEISDEPLPEINQQTLDEIIPDLDACSPYFHQTELQTEPHHNLTSPTTVLTDWVAGEMLSSNQNTGRRGAVSLLSNKIVPSTAFVVPQYVNVVYTSADRAENRDKHDKNDNSVKTNYDIAKKNSNSVVQRNEVASKVSPETRFRPVKNVYHHGYRVKQVSTSDNV